jgi:hypothetical protein
MTQVTIDSTLFSRLNGLSEPLEFRNEKGELLGLFIPTRKGPVQLLPADACPYSADDLLRMRNEGGGKPLAEIWKQLRGEMNWTIWRIS